MPVLGGLERQILKTMLRTYAAEHRQPPADTTPELL